jgi:hypothetical protein
MLLPCHKGVKQLQVHLKKTCVIGNSFNWFNRTVYEAPWETKNASLTANVFSIVE